jgi:hypothetical protein
MVAAKRSWDRETNPSLPITKSLRVISLALPSPRGPAPRSGTRTRDIGSRTAQSPTFLSYVAHGRTRGLVYRSQDTHFKTFHWSV